MKLSEAIRLGSLLGPQIFEEQVGWCLSGSGEVIYDPSLGTCAQGAILAAIGSYAGGGHIMMTLAPWVFSGWLQCPCSKCWAEYSAWGMLAHLNDRHRWTREQIADWVATIEPAGRSATIEPQTPVRLNQQQATALNPAS